MGFKLVFRESKLDDHLMPLVVFPGGYGGMVHTECGLVGLSCCIRRDVLGDRRRFYGSASAAEAVLSHIRATTTAVADTLRGAIEADVSLAAGPIHPGIRPRYLNGIFRVGNAAGEAHPVIAEGISMALQAGGLLAKTLIANGSLSSRSLEESGSQYSRLWISQFGLRIKMAELLTRLALSKHGPDLMARAVELFPSLLTVGANLSGKTKLAYGVRLEHVGT